MALTLARKLRLLRLGIVTIALCIAGLAALHLHQMLDIARQKQLDSVQHLAQVLAEGMEAELGRYELALRWSIDEGHDHLSSGIPDATALQQHYVALRRVMPGLDAVAIADADGVVIAGHGRTWPDGLSLADRPYFMQALRSGGETIVAGPIPSRTDGQPVLILACSLPADGGGAAGICAVSILLDSLRTPFASLQRDRPQAQVGLRDASFAWIIGDPGRAYALAPETQRALREEPQGSTYRERIGSDGEHSVISFKRLRRLPLYVYVAMPADGYFSPWLAQHLSFALLLLAALLALSITLRSIARTWRADHAAQAQMEAGLERFRSLFAHHSSVMLLIEPRDGELVDVNRAACTFYGYSRMIGMHLKDINCLAEEEAASIRNQVSQRRLDHYIVPHRLASGEIRQVEVHATPVQCSERTLIFAVIHDVTERIRAETAMREGEARIRALFQGSHDGFVMTDREGHFIDANPAYCALTGYNLDELRAKGDFFSITPERWHEPERQILLRLLRDKVGPLYEKEYIHRDGHIVPVEITILAVSGIDGVATRLWAVVRDISARRRIEDERQQHREHLEELVAQRSRERDEQRHQFEQYFTVARSLTVILDRSGRIERINPYGCELLGWSEGELIGRDWFATCVPPQSSGKTRASFERMLRDDTGAHLITGETVESDIVCRDGAVHRLVFRNALLRDPNGRVGGILSSAIDVTAARQAEETLRQAKEAAEQANRAKSAFLASISHEIRTPLNAIIGYAQLMGNDPGLATAQRDAVAVISRSGEHLLQLLNDLLEMSRIEAGAQTPQYETFDPRHLLAEVTALFRKRAQEKGLALTLEADDALPACIRTDQRRLRQILINLLANAVKFTEIGSIVVACGIRDGRLRLEVRDTGPGIPPGERDALFHPFAQTRVGRDRREGTGLGLAISRSFARLLGGSLEVDGHPKGGACFVLVLPLTPCADSTPHEDRRRVTGLAAQQRQPVLLVAEDHADSRNLLQAMLQRAGCMVIAVEDGAAAVTACRNRRPDAVLMDLNLPVMDGLAAAAIIARLPKPPPVIALTAAAFIEDRQRILAAGCVDLLHKPFREEDLFRLLERLLGLAFTWDAAPTSARSVGDDRIIADALRAVATEERERLMLAVVIGDRAACRRILAGWRDRELAGALDAMLGAFAFDRIERMLQDATGEQA